MFRTCQYKFYQTTALRVNDCFEVESLGIASREGSTLKFLFLNRIRICPSFEVLYSFDFFFFWSSVAQAGLKLTM